MLCLNNLNKSALTNQTGYVWTNLFKQELQNNATDLEGTFEATGMCLG